MLGPTQPLEDYIYTFAHIIESVFAAWLFSIAFGLLQFNFNGVYAFFRRRSPEEADFLHLTEMIKTCEEKMAALSPINDFAQYCRHDRQRNKFIDERTKLSAKITEQSLTHSTKVMLLVRISLMVVATLLATHASRQVILFSVAEHTFYPFNFMLQLPAAGLPWPFAASQRLEESELGNDDGVEVRLVPVSLFNFLLLGVFVRRAISLAKKETAKKLE